MYQYIPKYTNLPIYTNIQFVNWIFTNWNAPPLSPRQMDLRLDGRANYQKEGDYCIFLSLVFSEQLFYKTPTPTAPRQ